MSEAMVSVQAVCEACGGGGLYIGMGEKCGVAVVCFKCRGTGMRMVHYEPFVQRKPAPETVTEVHVARGYFLGVGSRGSTGGMPVQEWEPGVVVPADEKLYCPFLYTDQKWCAFPEENGEPPLGLGMSISNCLYWTRKSRCWKLYHEDVNAPKVTV